MQGANDSNNFADQGWYDLLVLAYNRLGRNSRKLSNELGIPFTTLLLWLKKKREPKDTNAIRSKLLAYFSGGK